MSDSLSSSDRPLVAEGTVSTKVRLPQSLYAVAALTEGFSTALFTLRRKDFAPLMDLPLEQDATDPRIFFAPATVPGQSFLVYVNGTDLGGRAFQRVVPVTITPQTVAITAPSPQDLRPGKVTTLMFQVKNFGPAASFNFSVTDDKRYVTSISPTNFTLNTAEIINVTVTLQPGATVPVGSSDTLTATVSSATNPSVTNTAALTLFVTGASIEAGRPDFVAGIVGQERMSDGVYTLDVRFTNTGPGTAKQFTLNTLAFRTLTGAGTVTVNSALAPPLPLVIPNVDVGAFVTMRLMVNVPASVRRFSITESGAVQDTSGAEFAFSQAQAVIPK